ncbi:MAG: S41 family peptidase [[Eubacterium] saphenum]|nr:S41 family peptidase [[Eubacterium] saphenum]
MNKRISLGVAISLIAIGCAITFVLTWTVSLNIYNSKISSADQYEGVYEKLREIDAVVKNNYIGSVSEESIESGIINGYVSGIGDKYASYLDANNYYELQQTTGGVVSGAGLVAQADGSGYLVVTKVYTNSSAHLNGVKAGDVITEIDGKSLLSMEEKTALEKISGEIGTKLTMKLLRDGEEINVSLIRQQIDIESVTGEMLENGIGYIKITSFNDKTAEQFAGALSSLTSSGLNSLILDVRQNGGGSIAPLKSMLNKLLPACVAATAEYANGIRKTLIETDSASNISVPMAVLVDGGTASAAELFAVALRDEGNALLVGTQTYGKAIIQGTYSFPDGTALTISNAKIIPSKSTPYDGVGLKPDYVTELPTGSTPDTVSRENDSQLQKAVEILTPAAPAAPETSE